MATLATVRGHNEGSLFQRRTGEWVAVVTMRDGKRRSRYSKTRDEAKADLAELLRLRDAGARDTGRVRLGPYLERWVTNDHGWAPATLRKHETVVRVHLVRGLGHIRLSDLRASDVDAVLANLEGLGPRSRNHVRATLRRALADAVRDGLTSRNAGGLARPPKAPQGERPILDADQARTLIESTKGTRSGPLWTLLVTTGMRISEALGLTWSNVSLDAIRVTQALQRVNGEWTFREPKTAKGRRSIPLTDIGREALRAQRAQQTLDRDGTPSTGLVFTSPTGSAIHATNLLPRLRADLAAAGLPKVGIHDLRHSCATLLYAQGVPIETIADILGHSTPRITGELYRHKVPQLAKDAAARLQEALG